jgi:hypothetical protein
MTPPKLLDEAALKERELQTINFAVQLIQQDDIEKITTDKVVYQVLFSKKIAYKRFISNYTIEALTEFFYRTYQSKCSTCVRVLMLNFLSLIFAMLSSVLFPIAFCVKSPNVENTSSKGIFINVTN